MVANAPFLLRPAAKGYLWGGSRLNDEFHMDLPVSPLAEAWVCSTHPDGESVLENGEPLDLAAVSLYEALDTLGGITGDRVDEKLLDDIFSRFCVGK